MIVRARDRTIQIDDTPVLFWIHALLFVVIGAIFIAGPIFLFADADRLRWWLRVLIAAVGALSVSVGTWLLVGLPRSRIIADATRSVVRLDRWGIGRRERFEWAVEELIAVQLSERRDIDGDPIFRLSLVVRDGRTIPMSDVWHHGRERLAEVTRQLADAIGARSINVGKADRLDSQQRVYPRG